MKKLLFFLLGTVVGAAAGVGLCAAIPVAASDGNHALAQCLTGVKLTFRANPSVVTLGQSSRLSWSVTAPEECGVVHVELNHKEVAREGAETLTPTRNRTFTLVATESYRGRRARQQADALVTVIFPLPVVIDGAAFGR